MAGDGVSGTGYFDKSSSGNSKRAFAFLTSIRLSSDAMKVTSSVKDSSIRWNTDANSIALPPCSTRHGCRTCRVQDRPRAVNMTVFVC